MNELDDVRVNRPSTSDRFDNGRKIIICQHYVRSFFGNFSSPLPHGDPDVSPLERRRVIHAVASNRDDFMSLL